MKSISGKKLCKIVKKYGWRLARIVGSHHIFEKEGSDSEIV
jgi:predicted RNA binding protein YcfA (HicA-like mRNA interferase family)